MNSLSDFSGMSMMSTLVLLSIRGSVVIGLVLLIRRLGRRRLSAQLRYWLWLPALFCLFVPFGVETAWSPFTSLSASPGAVATVGARAGADTAPASGAVNYTYVWALCALALVGMVLYNTIRYMRVQAKAHAARGTTHALLRQCKEELHIRRRVRVLESREVSTPLVFGWRKPIVLLPAGLAQEIDADELHYVLLHELAHVKRHDIAMNWLMTCVQILHWFNPVVWYGFQCMRRDREIACDARVLRHLRPTEHRAYGHALISLMERYPLAIQFSHGLGIVGNTKRMKERLHMIKQFRSFRKRDLIVGAAALLLVAALAFSQGGVSAHDPALHAEDAEESKGLHERFQALHDQFNKLHDYVHGLHGSIHSSIHGDGTDELEDVVSLDEQAAEEEQRDVVFRLHRSDNDEQALFDALRDVQERAEQQRAIQEETTASKEEQRALTIRRLHGQQPAGAGTEQTPGAELKPTP